MAKRRSWMDRLKKMLSLESESKQEKKERRKRRWLFGKLKKLSPALPPPPPPPPPPLRLRSLREAEKAQSERAVAAAVATAVAAEAALVAAQAAAQVVRLTGNISSCSVRKTREIAAMKIQASFRGYLARRALRALKGLVKLQALIRGQAVRHHTNIALRGLNSLMKIQSQARLNRMKPASNHHSHQPEDVLHAKAFGDAQHSDRKWNGSILTKEEIISLLRKRQEATFKRERAMDYAFTHQEWRHLHVAKLTTLRESQPRDEDIHKALPIQCPQDRILQNEQIHALESPGFRSYDRKAKVEDDEHELMYQARRSFNWSERAHSKDDDFFSLCSPLRPSYMASTASTKAKFRSASTPKQRPGTINSSDDFSFDKEKLFSPLALVKNFSKHQELAKQRGKEGPTKHLSFDSEPPYLLGWEKSGPFR